MFDLLPLTSAPDLSPRRRRPAADLVERTPRRTAAHGGQTTLNLAVSLVDSGALNRLRVRLIGASLPAIRAAEFRRLSKQAMDRIDLKTPPFGIGTTLEKCHAIAKDEGGSPALTTLLPSLIAKPRENGDHGGDDNGLQPDGTW
jgi:carbamoylphosphate synthase large subunit